MNVDTTFQPNQFSATEQQAHAVFFSPASLVAIFNAATVTKEEKKIIQVRGIFKKSGTQNYGGYYYDTLKDEASDYSITLLTSELLHNQLDDNKTIELNGFITRKMDKQGRIVIHLNLIELLTQTVNKFSEEEVKKILLINKKVATGFKDLDAHIKNAIFNNKRLSIKVIMGRSGIIDSDIKKGMEAAIALYNIEYHRVSLSSPAEIINKIISLDTPDTDIICVARGGGENLEIFENLEICNAILERKTIIASAIGHATDVTLFEKLSDKKFITPTQFGNYLKEIHNTTIEEFQRSKAKIIQDTKTELTTVYNKQIENLHEQLKATKELNEKTLADTKKNYTEQMQTLTDKLKSFEELVGKTATDKAALHLTEVNNLKKQMEDITALHQSQLTQINTLQVEKMKSLNDQIQNLHNQQSQKDAMIQQANNLATNYQKQLQDARSTSSPSILTIIIALIIGLIVGAILFSKQ
ncbi:MAG: hypothetical protein JWR61_1088 [Ferruginibacter sp.]|uniref:exodeoxyribonuclease VII large subunit n=1 Tax=Ferruginibacter sp. TaxID=1940288 RepID=UPI002657D21C|nr:exodeoxyribonuclease VII large subunit [Ferruginibacter sp.]MDB5276133.1 hypothetical protein [Ferruginibacter sp.]